MLRYLVASAGRLVTKYEIIGAVWSNVTVSDESLTRCISDIRLALRDQEQRIIKTVPRRGYRFAAQPLRPSAAAVDNLPAQTMSFLGRDKDLTKVRALLSEARLITLSGVGGVVSLGLGVQAGVAFHGFPAFDGHGLRGILECVDQDLAVHIAAGGEA